VNDPSIIHAETRTAQCVRESEGEDG